MSELNKKTIESCFIMTVLHKCDKCKGKYEINKDCSDYVPCNIEISEMSYGDFVDMKNEEDTESNIYYLQQDYRTISN